MRILIIEDDRTLAESIANKVAKNGVITSLVGNGIQAEQLLIQAIRENRPYDVVILDLTLPGMDGMDVLKGMRGRKDTTPVLILTARVTLADRVRGLDDGADDYLAKPFEPAELLARLRAVTRRHEDERATKMSLGNLEFDNGRGIFFVSSALLVLPRKTKAILEVLFRKRGNPVNKDLLLNLDVDGASSESVDTQISRLRKRLKDADANVSIKTIHGTGYMLEVVMQGACA